jgi:hypothetical protein
MTCHQTYGDLFDLVPKFMPDDDNKDSNAPATANGQQQPQAPTPSPGPGPSPQGQRNATRSPFRQGGQWPSPRVSQPLLLGGVVKRGITPTPLPPPGLCPTAS